MCVIKVTLDTLLKNLLEVHHVHIICAEFKHVTVQALVKLRHKFDHLPSDIDIEVKRLLLIYIFCISTVASVKTDHFWSSVDTQTYL